ncbi:hypothetical protein FOZ60_014616 [Perkinsus olseni]|uniref:U1-type domain-containing protein n=1 Tax=Perkinsus olseni TaxID=32597 RepID=A0A7J6PL45_PEROL|nr:hypothetical protein FOZ60_014616 [Perkinsus olseni]
MPSIGDDGSRQGSSNWSGEQNGSRSVLLSAAHTMAESGAKKDPPGEGSASYPADGPEKEPPTEQETASPERSPQAAAEVKKKKVEQKEDEKPDSSSWGRSNRWGEKSPSDSRALGGSLWKSSWDPDRRPSDNPPNNRRNYSSSSWDMPPDWDPQKDYDNLPPASGPFLRTTSLGCLEKGWLYCELCRKKTCISFDIMSNHLQSEKHQRYLRWMQMQPEEARMKAIEDMQLTNSPSKEELSAAVVPTAQGGGVGSGAEPPVIKQEDLPKFIELRPDCFYCTLCDARPQAWSSLESHVAGQRHRSRYERAEWEQSGQAAGWYGQLAASSASAASTTAPALPWTTSTSVSSSSVWQHAQPWQQPRSAAERPLFAPNGRLLPPGFRHARAQAKAKAAKAAGPPTRASFEADGVLL